MGNINKSFVENRETILLLIVPIAIVAKLIEHLLLPDKYFYDSNRMLGMTLENRSMEVWGGNYEITADVFKRINIFDFTTLLQWSIFIGIIFNIILVVAFVKIKAMNMMQSIFALMCVGLCNIYVFNLGKDVIQFTLFVMCFTIIWINKLPSWLKVMGCALVFYWESTFFRNYYIIMAAFTVGVYLIIQVLRRMKAKINAKTIIVTVSSLYFLMYVFLNIARIMMPNEYNDILTCKEGTEVMTASTMIYDQIEFGNNINLYMLNYIVNSIRMLFPVELLMGGIFYIPFLAFQVMLLCFMYKNIKNIHQIGNNNVIALSVFIAFFMGSVLFEPDFGSFARHEAAAFPIIILFALDNIYIIKDRVNSNCDEGVVIYE